MLSDAPQPVPSGPSVTIFGLSPMNALLAGAGLLLGVGLLASVAARRTASNPPKKAKKRKGFKMTPLSDDGQFLGRPYSRGILSRKLEKHKTLKGMAKGMIRWAGKLHGVQVTDKQAESMLGKAPKALRGQIDGVKRADIKKRAEGAFFGRVRKLHALPGTPTMAVEPAKGKKVKAAKKAGKKVGKKKSRKVA